MHWASDYIHHTPHGGLCRVRVFVSEEVSKEVSGEERPNVPAGYVVIVTELANNPGRSLTNAMEWIAGEVLYSNRLDPAETVVIEHYEASPGARGTAEDPATFDLVTFSYAEDTEPAWRQSGRMPRLGRPEWKALDRATAEVLVGEPLD